MKNELRITESSGNVYADLNLRNPELALAKAELAIRIKLAIERRRLTQVEAAKLLGVDQAKVSALIRGRLSGFSIDRLFRFLNALDRDVEIVVRPSPNPAGKRESASRPRKGSLERISPASTHALASLLRFSDVARDAFTGDLGGEGLPIFVHGKACGSRSSIAAGRNVDRCIGKVNVTRICGIVWQPQRRDLP